MCRYQPLARAGGLLAHAHMHAPVLLVPPLSHTHTHDLRPPLLRCVTLGCRASRRPPSSPARATAARQSGWCAGVPGAEALAVGAAGACCGPRALHRLRALAVAANNTLCPAAAVAWCCCTACRRRVSRQQQQRWRQRWRWRWRVPARRPCAAAPGVRRRGVPAAVVAAGGALPGSCPPLSLLPPHQALPSRTPRPHPTHTRTRTHTHTHTHTPTPPARDPAQRAVGREGRRVQLWCGALRARHGARQGRRGRAVMHV
jgi:hypothetical protein